MVHWLVSGMQGICPPLLIKRLNVAGRHITRYLIKLLQVCLLLRFLAGNPHTCFASRCAATPSTAPQTLRPSDKSKRRFAVCSSSSTSTNSCDAQVCYIGYDLAVEKQLALETTTLVQNYTLPDGRVIKCSSERYEAPEVRSLVHVCLLVSPVPPHL